MSRVFRVVEVLAGIVGNAAKELRKAAAATGASVIDC